MDWSPSNGSEVDSYRIGLDQIESDWIEPDRIVSKWVGLDRFEFEWIGLDRFESEWIGLDRFESEWIGLDRFGSEWIGLSVGRPVPFRTEPVVVYAISPELESGSSKSCPNALFTPLVICPIACLMRWTSAIICSIEELLP